MSCDVSDQITELRVSTGMSRKEFCDMLNIPYRTLQSWELGDREPAPYIVSMMQRIVDLEKKLKEAGQ